MFLKSLIAAAGLVGLVASSQAALIDILVSTFANDPGVLVDRALITSDGAAVPEGSLVRVGTLAQGADQADLGSTDPAVVAAALVFVGDENPLVGTGTNEARVGDDSLTPVGAGNIVNFINSVETSTPGLAPGSQLYLWVWNQPTDVVAAGTEWGVFSAGDIAWQIPTLGSARVNSGYVDEVYYGAILDDGAEVAGGGLLQLAPIPEPSALLFGLLGAGGLLLRRRR